MADLQLPYTGGLVSADVIFDVHCDDGGGVAIQGRSLGTDLEMGRYGGTGVVGTAEFGGIGVSGESKDRDQDLQGGLGVFGRSDGGAGVVGIATGYDRDGAAIGVEGFGPIGVRGIAEIDPNALGTITPDKSYGVVAINDNGTALYAQSSSLAASLEGHVQITGNLRADGDVHFVGNLTTDGDIFLSNADCAEEFTISEPAIDPGSVMIIDENGGLRLSRQEYDKRVAGVISGAGSLKPAITLDKNVSNEKRLPLALMGRVYCKVDADHAPIEVGDLLTTSFTPGCAMRASDPVRAFGSVIGKALQPLVRGKGLIIILVALQ